MTAAPASPYSSISRVVSRASAESSASRGPPRPATFCSSEGYVHIALSERDLFLSLFSCAAQLDHVVPRRQRAERQSARLFDAAIRRTVEQRVHRLSNAIQDMNDEPTRGGRQLDVDQCSIAWWWRQERAGSPVCLGN